MEDIVLIIFNIAINVSKQASESATIGRRFFWRCDPSIKRKPDHASACGLRHLLRRGIGVTELHNSGASLRDSAA